MGKVGESVKILLDIDKVLGGTNLSNLNAPVGEPTNSNL
jgi:hypothetical protein